MSGDVTTLWQHTANIVTMLQSLTMFFQCCISVISPNIFRFLGKLYFVDNRYLNAYTLLQVERKHLLHGGQPNQFKYEFFNVILTLAQSQRPLVSTGIVSLHCILYYSAYFKGNCKTNICSIYISSYFHLPYTNIIFYYIPPSMFSYYLQYQNRKCEVTKPMKLLKMTIYTR